MRQPDETDPLDHRTSGGTTVEVERVAIGARVLRAEDLDPHGARSLRRRRRAAGHAPRRVQAQHGPARPLVSVDASAARPMPGVVAVYTGRGRGGSRTRPARGAIGMHLMPGLRAPAVFGLATDKVRYVGDPIALVVAEDRYIAEDAVELIEEDIELLEPWSPTRTFDRPSRRCSTSSMTTSPTPANVARRRRRARSRGRPGRRAQASGCTATSRCRWSARG